MQRISISRIVFLSYLITATACDNSGSRTTGLDAGTSSGGSASDSRKPHANAQVVQASGNITAAVNEFRGLLGSLSPNSAGEQAGDRREVNWDGVPALFTDNDAFPGDFFNKNSPRGILLSTDGYGFRVSSNGFTDVSAAYAGEFNAFSPVKIFASSGGTRIDVSFVVAGSNTPALVNGFGSVFAGVDRPQATSIEYFGADGASLLKVVAPRRTDALGLSFVGAKFDSLIVARVRITAGDTPLNTGVLSYRTSEPLGDIVAMDDFIYGEPRQVVRQP
jgi:hypothetical protein